MPILTQADRDHFLEKGYVYMPQAFPREVAEEWAATAYPRLGYNANDPATWERPRIHMPDLTHWDVKDFAPRVWEAMGELLGGHDRIAEPCKWSDAFICNFGERADQDWLPAGPNTPGWHKDGDFFRHYLDSPEQGLLVFVNWTDVIHQGGPTYVATDSIKVMAEYLNDRPEGVAPNGFGFQDRIKECHDFIEAMGQAGDVYLLHPFTLHAGSQNILRVPRIITNPPVSLKEPMNFNRPDGDYSLVEQVILNALGVDSLDFQATGSRERIIPEREKAWHEEKARKAAQAG